MTLTDPQPALAEQSAFIGYLVGLAGLGRMVHSLAADEGRSPGESDDFVYLLLGLAGIGAGIEQLTEATPSPTTIATHRDAGRWLR
ncbi:hypothetical protein ACXPWS_24850 [Mycobacterium sp. BMJ-28]